MNFYKHHIGDYSAKTSHLSWDEDCAYRRLLDAYYKRETPIPVDLKDACRLARASTPSQRRAVEAVLLEFFSQESDGWHQKRCDEEIGKASAQAETNRHIAEKREADKRARIEHESLQRKGHESSHESSTVTRASREPSQTPDTRLQTPERDQELADRSPVGSAPPLPPPDFTGENAEALNGKAVVALAARWELPEQWGIDAEALGWKPREVLLEAEKFRQYWTTGKGANTRRAVKGWRQTWSNWLGKAAERKR